MNTQTFNKSRTAKFYFKLINLVKVYGLEDALLLLKYIEGHTKRTQVIKTLPLYASPPIKKGSYWLLFSPDVYLPKDKITQSDVSQVNFYNSDKFFLFFIKNKKISIWEEMRNLCDEHNNLSIEMLECQSKLNETRKYKPHRVQKRFEELKPNLELLKKLIRKNQKEYIRRRLRAILMLWTGSSRQEVEEKLDVNPSTLINWLKILVEHGAVNSKFWQVRKNYSNLEN